VANAPFPIPAHRTGRADLRHPAQWLLTRPSAALGSFPGHGQMKPEQAEIARLKREVLKLKAERDILKKAAAYFAKEST
jgi:transposase